MYYENVQCLKHNIRYHVDIVWLYKHNVKSWRRLTRPNWSDIGLHNLRNTHTHKCRCSQDDTTYIHQEYMKDFEASLVSYNLQLFKWRWQCYVLCVSIIINGHWINTLKQNVKHWHDSDWHAPLVIIIAIYNF